MRPLLDMAMVALCVVAATSCSTTDPVSVDSAAPGVDGDAGGTSDAGDANAVDQAAGDTLLEDSASPPVNFSGPFKATSVQGTMVAASIGLTCKDAVLEVEHTEQKLVIGSTNVECTRNEPYNPSKTVGIGGRIFEIVKGRLFCCSASCDGDCETATVEVGSITNSVNHDVCPSSGSCHQTFITPTDDPNVFNYIERCSKWKGCDYRITARIKRRPFVPPSDAGPSDV